VETLAGQVLAVEVDAGASLIAMRSGIEREVGIMAKQQRLIILGARISPGSGSQPDRIAQFTRS
jgi:hypothetical protein